MFPCVCTQYQFCTCIFFGKSSAVEVHSWSSKHSIVEWSLSSAQNGRKKELRSLNMKENDSKTSKASCNNASNTKTSSCQIRRKHQKLHNELLLISPPVGFESRKGIKLQINQSQTNREQLQHGSPAAAIELLEGVHVLRKGMTEYGGRRWKIPFQEMLLHVDCIFWRRKMNPVGVFDATETVSRGPSTLFWNYVLVQEDKNVCWANLVAKSLWAGLSTARVEVVPSTFWSSKYDQGGNVTSVLQSLARMGIKEGD